jgi:serine protease Do
MTRKFAIVLVVALTSCRLVTDMTKDRDSHASENGLPPSATIVAPSAKIARSAPAGTAATSSPSPIGMPGSFAPLASKAAPAVVTIYTKVAGRMGRLVRRGLGSGFVIDSQGTVVTNNHVIEGAAEIEVQLADGSAQKGKLLGRDAMTDIAVLRIDPPAGVDALPLGNSDEIAVGDWVVAIGNPLGLSHTVTAGILSARGRSNKDVPLTTSNGGRMYLDFLQTDAAINPGNSGGPLLNLRGEVIGINTAINAQGQGLAFAIPINMVRMLLPALVKDGHLVRAYLGVSTDDAYDGAHHERGAKIMRVWRTTPADKASLKAGDVIEDVDGQPVRDASHLSWLISISGVGKTVTLRVQRAENEFDLPVTLERMPEQPPAEPEEDDNFFLPGFP